MSAIPLKAYKPRKVNNFLALPIERTDDVLLTDEEYFQLKGGINWWGQKTLWSLNTVLFYLALSGRLREFYKCNITGPTFIRMNVIFFASYFFMQKGYNKKHGLTDRVQMHNNAFIWRALNNYQFMMENKKAPKFH